MNEMAEMEAERLITQLRNECGEIISENLMWSIKTFITSIMRQNSDLLAKQEPEPVVVIYNPKEIFFTCSCQHRHIMPHRKMKKSRHCHNCGAPFIWEKLGEA